MRQKLNKFLEKLNQSEKMIMGIIFMVLTVLICIQVTIRWIGLQSFSWLEEFSQYMFICIAFCGASIAVTEDSHMKIRLLESILPPKVNRVIEFCMNLICAGAALVIMRVAFKNTLTLYKVKSLSTVMAWPVWVIYAIVTACLLGMTLRFILRAVWPPKKAKEEE